jgi:hypothetical protein
LQVKQDYEHVFLKPRRIRVSIKWENGENDRVGHEKAVNGILNFRFWLHNCPSLGHRCVDNKHDCPLSCFTGPLLPKQKFLVLGVLILLPMRFLNLEISLVWVTLFWKGLLVLSFLRIVQFEEGIFLHLKRVVEAKIYSHFLHLFSI